MVQDKTYKGIPLSEFKNDSHPLSTVLCFDGAWSDGAHKTWGDFLCGTAVLRRQIEAVSSSGAANGDKWLLHCEDCWYFLLGFTALLQCKKEIILSANVSPAYIAEIRNMGSEAGSQAVPFFTDLVFNSGETPQDIYYIPEILKAVSDQDAAIMVPIINADETSIIMYTSGSTGQPKAVQHRLSGIENDYFFKVAEWGEDYLKRKIFTTVSHHHFYGLSSAILMPFELGVPFRRKKIDFPEELEKLTCDAEYAIFTVPAFLKRAVETENTTSLKMKSPWILTSGGLLDYDLAKKTNEVIGFWPIEGFGSTETGGIAYRQSCNGCEWMPFKSIKIGQAEDGCMLVHLPEPPTKFPADSKEQAFCSEASRAGIKTADVIELLDDGRFLLKGRIDSFVKIEEKRISLPEIENRILQSGLASDVCVIAMESKRQYLAAAIVFNVKGKEQFNGMEKNEINKFWRQYLSQYLETIVIPRKWRYISAIPFDSVGKKKREDIEKLFSNNSLD